MINITQRPYLVLMPASTPTIYVCKCDTVVLNETQVKFICEISVARNNDVNTNLPIATLKTSPNRRGVGMFDVSPVVEAYVKAQHEGRQGITSQNPNQDSSFKLTNFYTTNATRYTLNRPILY